MHSSDHPETAPKVLRPVQRHRSFGTLRTVIALMLREMQTTYGRSPGGYVWAVLEPVGGIALLSFVFAVGFRSPPLGTNFPIFYATGMIPFLFYSDVSGKLAGALNFSRQLLSYPAVTYIDAIMGRFMVNVLSQLMVAYVVFTGILLLFDTQTVLDLQKIALAFGMAIALATGVGTMNCFLFMQFPVWMRIWGILNRPMFIISCIFFLFDTIPQPFRDFLWYNPLVHIVGTMRSGFYPSYDAPYVSVAYVMGVSLILTVIGLVFLRKYHRDLLTR